MFFEEDISDAPTPTVDSLIRSLFAPVFGALIGAPTTTARAGAAMVAAKEGNAWTWDGRQDVGGAENDDMMR